MLLIGFLKICYVSIFFANDYISNYVITYCLQNGFYGGRQKCYKIA